MITTKVRLLMRAFPIVDVATSLPDVKVRGDKRTREIHKYWYRREESSQ